MFVCLFFASKNSKFWLSRNLRWNALRFRYDDRTKLCIKMKNVWADDDHEKVLISSMK